MTELSAIILMDEYSKLLVKSNVSVLGPKGIKFIDSIKEIDSNLVELTNKVIILEGFTKKSGCVSDLEMYKALYNLDLYFLGADDTWLDAMSSIAKCFKCNIAMLDYAMVQAAVFGDSTQIDTNAEPQVDMRSDAEFIVSNADNYDPKVVEIANELLALLDYSSVYKEKVQRLSEQNQRLQTVNAMLGIDRDLLLKGYKQILVEAKKECKMLHQYEQIFSKDVYTKIRLHEYSNRPLVIYLKEFEDFVGINQLVDTLYSVFKIQQRKTVKVVRLFDKSTSRKMLTVPDHYKHLYNDYTMADVFANDYICKSGDYVRILDKILLNEMMLDVLIIVDSKDFNDTILSGMTLQINLCRENSHAVAFGLNPVNTIVNYGAEERRVWERYDLSKITDKNEQFVYLSSRPAIQGILELCSTFEESI